MRTRTLATLPLLATLVTSGCDVPPDDALVGGETSAAVEQSSRALVSGEKKAQSSWADKNFPPELKWIGQNAASIAGYVSGISGGLQSAQAIFNLLNGTAEPTQEELFRMLNEHLDQIGIEVVEFVGSSFEDLRLSAAQTSLRLANQWIKASPNTPIPIDSNINFWSSLAVTNAFKDSAFNRKLKGRDGLVWDWRVGLPPLMQVIAIRLNVLSLMNPAYKDIGVFDDELVEIRTKLQAIYDKMQGGVTCKNNSINSSIFGISLGENSAWTECSDKYSGASITERKGFDLAKLRRRFTPNMMFFELRSMIDTVDLYRSGRRDLTAADRRIAASGNRGLCVDTPNGAFDVQLQLYPCNGTGAQTWVYNRETGEVKNPSTGACLDVNNSGVEPGTTIGTWHCNGSAAQRWTYNVYSEILESATGLVLDVPFGDLFNGAKIQGYPRNDGLAQRFVP